MGGEREVESIGIRDVAADCQFSHAPVPGRKTDRSLFPSWRLGYYWALWRLAGLALTNGHPIGPSFLESLVSGLGDAS